MALQFNGLKAKALRARSNVDALNQAYDAFNAKAGNHAEEVKSLTTELGGMQADLDFAVNTLGNSSGVSDSDKDTANETER